jgi:ABC-type uncharacterized transport system permease subunit
MIETLSSGLVWTAFLAATVRLAIPILTAAAGEVVAERSGILNIAVEGMMLVGAFFAVLGSYATGSPWLGMLWGVLAASVVAAIHAYFSITVLADQVVSGAAINIVCLGLTGFLNRLVFGGADKALGVPRFDPVAIPLLSDIPVVGKALFEQTVPAYLSGVLIAVLWVFIWKTTWGLNLRSVGEYPLAAETLGINVFRTRYVATIVGGAFAGFGGAFLSLAILNFFIEQMTNGRGFIALAAVIFGRWNPVGVLAACILFAGADALQITLKTSGIQVPYQLMLMLPYVLTILALAFFAGHPAVPKALYVPYRRAR